MNKYAEKSRIARRERAILKGCINKKQYETLEDAACKNCDVYKCKNCGKYHRTMVTFRMINYFKYKKT